jgi:hypothetical protein
MPDQAQNIIPLPPDAEVIEDQRNPRCRQRFNQENNSLAAIHTKTINMEMTYVYSYYIFPTH